MNKPHETHPTRANLEARIKELEGGQHAQSMAAVARHKGETETVDNVIADLVYVKNQYKDGSQAILSIDAAISLIGKLYESLAAANKRAEGARAVAIEEVANRALAALPPSHVVVPLDPTTEMIDAAEKVQLSRIMRALNAATNGTDPDTVLGTRIVDEWNAMLAARPKLPKNKCC